MNANELRIGNYCMENEVVTKCSHLSPKVVITEAGYPIGVGYSEIEPISLTEEWILKLGFKKRPFPYGYYPGCHELDRDDRGHQYIKDGLIISVYMFPNQPIRHEFIYPSPNLGEYNLLKLLHVHQLQNLYFALTGKELIISE